MHFNEHKRQTAANVLETFKLHTKFKMQFSQQFLSSFRITNLLVVFCRGTAKIFYPPIRTYFLFDFVGNQPIIRCDYEFNVSNGKFFSWYINLWMRMKLCLLSSLSMHDASLLLGIVILFLFHFRMTYVVCVHCAIGRYVLYARDVNATNFVYRFNSYLFLV